MFVGPQAADSEPECPNEPVALFLLPVKQMLNLSVNAEMKEISVFCQQRDVTQQIEFQSVLETEHFALCLQPAEIFQSLLFFLTRKQVEQFETPSELI